MSWSTYYTDKQFQDDFYRCVYSNHEESAIFNLCDSSIVSFYLVPFLDLLNHSPDAEVNAKFNFKTNCFEIITLNSIKRFEQVSFLIRVSNF